MEIAILTSSRADYGLYRPLMNELKKQKTVKAGFVVFGTHLSSKHGNTVDQIKADGYKIWKEIKTLMKGDSPEVIAKTIGQVHEKFASYWAKTKFDLVICLGDRYEMYGAVSASVPFNIPVVHISGGEETLGAIDNYYRHALTLMSAYHFTNTKNNARRVAQILNSDKNVFFTGSLTVDNINGTKLLSSKEFKKKFQFDISEPFVLFTFHPETVNYKQNVAFGRTIRKVLGAQKMNVLVTMPNADTMGDTIRKELFAVAKENKHIHLVESLGSRGYYTAMKKCLYVMGNSSSGIVEAASFGKYVINMGDRQKGREQGKNIVNVSINEKEIGKAMERIKTLPQLGTHNIYGDGKAAARMQKVLSKIKKDNG
ncbi:MAG: UDP-N-acetyl-D-glucosamine 2-epimerase, UDP-hydrolyzing [Bacteroidetes bacterium]|jgi:GDP/UDP-N,N'-diacetylbacillosamine 2-epimerase (hydrolysing)|nr:UDP-N-acetyl-D-glucosamine 2-epimerase, UDP-hydrolyzing [Bacteroidota bacterium]